MIDLIVCDDHGDKSIYECKNPVEFHDRINFLMSTCSRLTVLQEGKLIVHVVRDIERVQSLMANPKSK